MKKADFIFIENVLITEKVTTQVKASVLFTRRFFYIIPRSSISNFLFVKVKKDFSFTPYNIQKVLKLAADFSEEDFHNFMLKLLPENRIIDKHRLIEFDVFSHWYASGVGYREQTGTRKSFGIKPRSLAIEVQKFYNKQFIL